MPRRHGSAGSAGDVAQVDRPHRGSRPRPISVAPWRRGGSSGSSHPMSPVPDLAAALKLFDETTAALSARLARMDEVLGLKQQELVDANRRLSEQVGELDRLSGWL